MSTIVTDTLQGKTSATSITLPTTTNIGSTPLVSASANSMTIRGEGSATTNIQQGLAKVWCKFDGTQSSPSYDDSFNTSGLTDVATGNFTVTFANDMGNDDYATSVESTYFCSLQDASTTLAGSCQFGTYNYNADRQDREESCMIVFGDLA